MDWRGMGPPQQSAPPSVPSLLAMAQGEAPAMGDFRGGGGSGQEPWANAIAGAAPGYNPGTTQGGYNAVFDPRAPSSTGGWFTMEDYLNQAPSAMEAAGWGPQSPDGRGGGGGALSSGGMQSPQRGPRVGSVNNNALSTNNWRLLGNDPDQFMINGTVVNRRQIGRDLAPKSVLGTEGTGFPGYSFLGGGQWAYPVSSQGASQGYIGSDNWQTSSTPTY